MNYKLLFRYIFVFFLTVILIGLIYIIIDKAGNGISIRTYFEGTPEDGDFSKYRMGNCEVIKYENKAKE